MSLSFQIRDTHEQMHGKRKRESRRQQAPIGQVVGQPLSPLTLSEMNALPSLPSQSFDAHSNWALHYHIFASRGHLGSKANKVMGRLSLTRTASTDVEVVIAGEQRIAYAVGNERRMIAQVHLSRDASGTPRKWSMSTRFVSRSGTVRDELNLDLRGQVHGKTIALSRNGRQSQVPFLGNLCCDWGLIDTLQRNLHDWTNGNTFTYLEEFQMLKHNHRLIYGGLSEQAWGGSKIKLHQFHQLGRGIGPIEYWLTETGLLVLFTTFSIAYILDANA